MVGFRKPNGILATLQTFKTVQIPRLVRDKPGGWNPLVCLEFGHRVLAFLKDTVQRDIQIERSSTSSGVWRVKFVPGSGLSVGKLSLKEVDEVVNGEDRVGFLPRWYWDEIQGLDSIRPVADRYDPSDS